jgi:DNA (cytosine-5)-methyltransferase 1
LKTAITFFAGAGGACAGLEQAGFEVAWANEYYGPIADIWQLNHPAATLDRRDVLELPIEDIPCADLHWYSPPCPEHSAAKHNRTGGTDREDVSIAQKIGAIIMAKLPEAIVIENVPGYARSHSFEYLLAILSRCGYNVSWAVLNAADYGTPQTRERLILVARLSVIAALPQPTHSKTQFDQIQLFGPRLLPWVGWYEATADLLPSLQSTKLSVPQMAELERRGLLARPSMQLVDGKANSYGSSITCRAENEPAYTITANAGTRQVSRIVLVQLTGYRQSGPAVKFQGDPVFTITASMAQDNKGSARSPATIATAEEVLRVDRRCLARFQGFPDSHRWGEIESVNCRGVGNAVAVQLAKAVGLALFHGII